MLINGFSKVAQSLDGIDRVWLESLVCEVLIGNSELCTQSAIFLWSWIEQLPIFRYKMLFMVHLEEKLVISSFLVLYAWLTTMQESLSDLPQFSLFRIVGRISSGPRELSALVCTNISITSYVMVQMCSRILANPSINSQTTYS